MNKKILQKALAETYQAFVPFSKKYRVDFKRYLFSLEILSNLPRAAELCFVDIGTGIGILPLALKRLGFDALGMDYFIFPEQKDADFAVAKIDTLKNIWQKEGVEIKNTNIYSTNLPTVVGQADVVVSEAMIEHLKDPKRFLEQLYKILRPGGYLLLTTPNSATLLQRFRFLLGRSPNWPIEEFFKVGENFTGHWREYTGKELKYMCTASGFEIVSYWNKNLLAGFKESNWRKNFRALVAKISWLVPGAREMHYILARKK